MTTQISQCLYEFANLTKKQLKADTFTLIFNTKNFMEFCAHVKELQGEPMAEAELNFLA